MVPRNSVMGAGQKYVRCYEYIESFVVRYIIYRKFLYDIRIEKFDTRVSYLVLSGNL